MRYLSLQQDVQRALDTDPDVGPPVLATICDHLGWDFGARWELAARGDRLQCAAEWRRRAASGVATVVLGRDAELAAEGVFGTVIDERSPIWNPSANGRSPRDQAAAEAGLRGVAVFPLWRGSEVAGLLEFRFGNADPPTRDEYVALGLVARAISDRLILNRCEHDLVESDGLYQHLVELSPHAVIVHRGGDILYANEMAVRLLDTGPADLAGRRLTDFVAPEYRDRVDEEIAGLRESGGPDAGTHFQWKRHDGRMIDVEVAARLVRMDGESAVQLVVRDISERIHREHRVHFTSELSEALRPLVDPDQITETAAHMLQDVLEVMGCAYAEVQADEDTFVVGPVMAEPDPGGANLELTTSSFGEEAARMLRLNQPFVVDDMRTDPRLTPRERKMYEAFRLRSAATAPLHKDGRFVAIMSVYDDHPRKWRKDEVELVTAVASRCWESIERARALRELQLSEQRLRLAQMAGRVGVFEWDIQADRVIWSPDLERLYGLDPGEFDGGFDAWCAHIVPEDGERIRHTIKSVTDSGQRDFNDEFRALLGDGSTRWLSLQARVTYDRNGRPVRMLGVNVDIEARKRAEAERELLLSQAEVARAEAEEANRAKSIFLTNMSHELRTPINAISGYADLMAMGITGPTTEKQQTHLERIKVSSDHLLTLVNEVLDLAKVESGQLTVARDRLRISDVVKEALSMVDTAAEKHEVEIINEVPGEEPLEFFGDADRVRQILVNLLTNAVKFTRPGGRVSVAAGVADPAESDLDLDVEGQWLRVDVEDTGIGLPPDVLEEIFAPFYQVDSGYTRQGEGTGLGLSISRRLARLMGGDLTVQSEEGKGSRFTVWLPMTLESEEGHGRIEGSVDREIPGLADVGSAIVRSADEIVAEVSKRIRQDPAIDNAKDLDRAQLIDHTATFLVDIGVALLTLDEGGQDTVLSDGAEIQRTISELHGAQRGRLGWTEEAVHREFEILKNVTEEVVQRILPEGAESTVDEATAVVSRLLDRAARYSAKSRARALHETE